MKKEPIYIIDDNSSICQALKFMLESLNFKVKWYLNPLHFFELNIPALKGFVILDLCMPIMNGFEVIKKIRAKNNHIKIIAISGISSQDTEKRVLQEGGQLFFAKPLNTMRLINEISKS
ncbi:MAG: response regulator [Legionella sp.]|nr:MAG: response regulator [Legionella sp.]